MSKHESDNLRLGPDVIHMLLPHRRPFLMVDAVRSFADGPQPTLRTARHISANEPVFEGHFPGLHLWPGVYTIEGFGQTCNLLQVICGIRHLWKEQGGDPEGILEALRNLELGFRFNAGFRPDASQGLSQILGPAVERIGFSAGVDIKLLKPVMAGQVLEFRVTRTKVLGDLLRFDVEAESGGHVVARGNMTSKQGAVIPTP